MIHGCVCGDDYTGPSCVERTCALGDDPLTSGQVNEIQIMACVGDGDIVLRFDGKTTAPIPGGSTAKQVEAALEGVGRSIGDVVVTFSNRDRLCYRASDPPELMNVAYPASLVAAIPSASLSERYVLLEQPNRPGISSTF